MLANRRRRIAMLLPLGTALLFVALYAVVEQQVTRTKADVAAALVDAAVSKAEVRLEQFFEPPAAALRLVRTLIVEGAVDRLDPASIAGKLIPALADMPHVAAVVLASDDGQSITLRSDQNGWLTDETEGAGDGGRLSRRIRWETPTSPQPAMTGETDYDPRDRPWFEEAIAAPDSETITWTRAYTFYASREPGVTATTRWTEPGNPNRVIVAGIDVRLADIAEFLADIRVGSDGIAFLLSDDGRVLLPAHHEATSEPTLVPIGEHGVGAVAKAYQDWQADGGDTSAPFSLTASGEAWWAAFRPYPLGDRSVWLGVAMPEVALLDQIGAWQRQLPEVVAVAGVIALIAAALVGRRLAHSEVPAHRHEAAADDEASFAVDAVRRVVGGGETENVEFKATVRCNLKTHKPGKEIEVAWLKSVVAFLNTDGGTIVLGVNDDGAVRGLAEDGFSTDDHALRHVNNLIEQHIGGEAFAFIRARIVNLGGDGMESGDGDSRVVVIRCRSLPSPAFLRVGQDEDFYIRSGPASRKLPPSRILTYLESRKAGEATASS